MGLMWSDAQANSRLEVSSYTTDGMEVGFNDDMFIHDAAQATEDLRSCTPSPLPTKLISADSVAC